MAKHTPGPWKALPPIKTGAKKWMVTGIEQNNGKIATIEDKAGFQILPSEANASLIAAAPELLEALKLALNILTIHATDEIHAELTMMQQAITKAEGL